MTVLIAPLDWGLGHATRCIPIIKELISLQCDVIIATNGPSFFLLKNEFPELKILQAPGYNIKYSKRKHLLPFAMLMQTPSILYAILKEHIWLKKISSKYLVDAVISDNRFGMFNKNILSVYVTHQLLIKTGNKTLETFLQKLHSFFIKKYNQCWIADEEVNAFAGELSHVKKLPQNSKFIGILSRFTCFDQEKQFDLLVCLSGPEPQRTVFENLLLKQIRSLNKKILFVRGLPGSIDEIEPVDANIVFVNHLPSEDLNKAFLQSEIIISRCGYTTIMDLIKIKRNAILVPTPGQTEQEYLARYLMEKKYFYCKNQDEFLLAKVLSEVKDFPFAKLNTEMNGYRKAVKELIERGTKNNPDSLSGVNNKE